MRQLKRCTASRSKLRSRRRGSTIVEAAATIFALLFLTFGLIQAGLIYNAMLSLNNLAHDGARYASIKAKAELAKIPGPTPETAADRAARETKAKAVLAQLVSDYLKGRAQGTSIEQSALNVDKLTIQTDEIRSSQPMRLLIAYDMKKNKGVVPALLPLPDRFANYVAEGSNLIE